MSVNAWLQNATQPGVIGSLTVNASHSAGLNREIDVGFIVRVAIKGRVGYMECGRFRLRRRCCDVWPVDAFERLVGGDDAGVCGMPGYALFNGCD